MAEHDPEIVKAHDQTLTIHLVEHIPEHGPRGPHFEAAKKRMKAMGLDKCVVPGCTTGAPIEYHHTIIEHAWQGGVDIDKLNAAYGLDLDDASFKEWVEGVGNLEPLCSVHHRTQLGIHSMPEPLWNAIRLWRDDMPPPAEHVSAS